MPENASRLYIDFLEMYFYEYNELPDAKRNKMEPKYDPDNLFLETYHCDNLFENEESIGKTRESDKEEFYMPPLERDEEELNEGHE